GRPARRPPVAAATPAGPTGAGCGPGWVGLLTPARRNPPAGGPRGPACTAHPATPRRTCRKRPSLNLAAYGAAARGVPACPDDDATSVPYLPGWPLNLDHYRCVGASATGPGTRASGCVGSVGSARLPLDRGRS